MAAKKKTKPAKKSVATKKPAAKSKAPAKKKAPLKKKPRAKKKAAGAQMKGADKKPVARQKPATKKKAVAQKASPTKAATKQSGNGAESAEVKSAKKTRGRQNVHLTTRDIEKFRSLLLNLRDQVVDEISFLAGDNLSGSGIGRTGEEGTDNFNREFALKLVSNEQDIIYEIDAAIQRINNGSYGLCEISGDPIEVERLKVLPHARHCVKVQSELEKGRTRYRPFGPSISRGPE